MHARLLGVVDVEEVHALGVVRDEQAVAVDEHVVGDGGGVRDELGDLARRGGRRDVPALDGHARALVRREEVAAVPRQPRVVGEPPAGEEARDLTDAARIAHVQERFEPVVDRGGEEHVAAGVGVVDVEVGERSDLARILGVRADVEDAHAARAAVGAVDEEQPAVGVDPEAVRGAEGLAPGLDLPRVIGVLHADDVEPPRRLRGHVHVFAVRPDLAPLAVRAGHERDVARTRGIGDLHDGRARRRGR